MTDGSCELMWERVIKVMEVVRNVNNANMGMDVSLDGVRLEEVECFKYLGSNVDRS